MDTLYAICIIGILKMRNGLAKSRCRWWQLYGTIFYRWYSRLFKICKFYNGSLFLNLIYKLQYGKTKSYVQSGIFRTAKSTRKPAFSGLAANLLNNLEEKEEPKRHRFRQLPFRFSDAGYQTTMWYTCRWHINRHNQC